jgi:hypothetical protein
MQLPRQAPILPQIVNPQVPSPLSASPNRASRGWFLLRLYLLPPALPLLHPLQHLLFLTITSAISPVHYHHPLYLRKRPSLLPPSFQQLLQRVEDVLVLFILVSHTDIPPPVATAQTRYDSTSYRHQPPLSVWSENIPAPTEHRPAGAQTNPL